MSVLDEFEALYDFGLDDFQRRACAAVAEGRGVLVAAPTGSGKTIVGEFAVHLSLHLEGKCFYTTPIKALSNQKYADLVRRYGSDRVGLLTGDTSINGEAPIVVMTTEVLRNMLYAGSDTLTGLRHVVMDEVHYLADRTRGAVWEEVIIHLPESVTMVSLSATVSNAEEFGDWLVTVRGSTDVIVEERRPVPLFQHVMAGERLYDLFEGAAPTTLPESDPDDGPPVNPVLRELARTDHRPLRDRRPPKRGRGGRQPYRQRPGRRLVPHRVDVVRRLHHDGLLPAIAFIFSRAGCDKAVETCLHARVRLTTPAEAAEIRAYADRMTASLPDADLDVLGYDQWLEALTHGVSCHHAGLLPVFKDIVEALFARGLIKVVFATETLALGINMPARSVVIERLSKWNGETHADITPGEYTQLTGRAGRRGIDVEGHAVVLWAPGLEPEAVAGLASTRTYPLRSSFQPSYNMAVNLVRDFGRETSRELLESSFAQFQADRAVVGLARKARKAEEALEGYGDAVTCDRGDFMDYARIRRQISDRESGAAKRRKAEARDEAEESLQRLRIGDVIEVPAGKFAGFAVVVDPGLRASGDGPRPLVVTPGRSAKRLSLTDFPRPVEAVARLRVSRKFNPKVPQMRRDLAQQLRERTRDLPKGGRRRTAAAGDDPEVTRLRAELREHPCHGCPDREDHARWAERYLKLEREVTSLRDRISQRTNTVSRQFDRVCAVLDELGYLELEHDRVTEAGDRLGRIYSELDLLAAECLRGGIWEDLDVPGLAAAVSALVFESRKPEDAPAPRLPGGGVPDVVDAMTRIFRDLQRVERRHKVSYLKPPDLGFAWAAHRWADGADLDDVLTDIDLAPGDFVRWVKQELDLLEQLAEAAGPGQLRRTARGAADAMRRGVVAYSADVELSTEPEADD